MAYARCFSIRRHPPGSFVVPCRRLQGSGVDRELRRTDMHSLDRGMLGGRSLSCVAGSLPARERRLPVSGLGFVYHTWGNSYVGNTTMPKFASCIPVASGNNSHKGGSPAEHQACRPKARCETRRPSYRIAALSTAASRLRNISRRPQRDTPPAAAHALAVPRSRGSSLTNGSPASVSRPDPVPGARIASLNDPFLLDADT